MRPAVEHGASLFHAGDAPGIEDPFAAGSRLKLSMQAPVKNQPQGAHRSDRTGSNEIPYLQADGLNR